MKARTAAAGAIVAARTVTARMAVRTAAGASAAVKAVKAITAVVMAAAGAVVAMATMTAATAAPTNAVRGQVRPCRAIPV
ncbi:hypothetical protein AA0521_3084 [Komagataeibacter intermedius NRIC 0521]|uniref:Uncharacterized protein n=1 Tax=Komagataeibacter intermedius NRIC 0521 TaxID=1307934 RepID=A0ABQ0PQV1_9PROT|nr:hypothetical protein AA0521_3084 [Komagataeibacter intermedius NRIC 0521]